MDPRQQAIDYAHQNSQKFYDQLVDLVRIPSVSTNPENKPDMQRAAEWLAAELKLRGCTRVEIMPTPLHPVVYGEMLSAGPDKPTVLLYGHYDVQPVDPIDLWHSDPFEATRKGDYLYARGTSDMKGQIIAALKAIESIQSVGPFPVNIKYIFEGEEEIGSPNLEPFMKEHTDLLKCDFALNPDSGMIAPDVPTIVYALRGLGYFEIRLYGQDHDLHSGLFGGVVLNPANVLCSLVAGMKDAANRVTIPGFYDDVRPLDEDERKELARLPLDDQYYLTGAGATALDGEAGYTAVERATARPTLDVNGFYSGFIGEGSKTVLPCYAMAKVSTRLVPDQDPARVKQGFIEYLNAHVPAGMRYELIEHAGSKASITDIHTPYVQALVDAMDTVWGKRPVYKREGGSIPVVGHMKEILNAESVLTGFGLPEDNIHAPDEHLMLSNWYRGIDALIHYFLNL